MQKVKNYKKTNEKVKSTKSQMIRSQIAKNQNGLKSELQKLKARSQKDIESKIKSQMSRSQRR